MLGGRITGFGTSQPSIFFSTDRSMSYPNTGIEHPGALMRSRTMTWTACFTIPRPRRGAVEPARLVRSCLKDLRKRRPCRSTGGHPDSKDRFAEIFGEMRSRHCEHLLFQSDLSSIELPGKR